LPECPVWIYTQNNITSVNIILLKTTNITSNYYKTTTVQWVRYVLFKTRAGVLYQIQNRRAQLAWLYIYLIKHGLRRF
jgi:hypothetical protein